MILGLGNPGSKYSKTRHNVGFSLLELLSEQLRLPLKKPFFKNYCQGVWSFSQGECIHLIKPLTYMNRSGDILPSLMRKTRVEVSGMIVVTDNMDLPPGRIRMKKGGSSAGHNGLKSIMGNLESADFFRLYIGVGRPEKGGSVVDHVLGDFTHEEQNLINEALKRSVNSLLNLGEKTAEQVMNEINSGKG